ncbi:MAG: hypothetical protein KKG10_02975, partial [Proteobacteria bacterium]|nr:hypothetical protein [Pseudomonadota bacterium]
VTSGGGYPLDATFYQISKALVCSMDILINGGTIIVACECREGIGSPEFRDIMCSVSNCREFSERYSDPKDFVIDQWCAQNLYQVVDHAGSIYVYSPSLSNDELKRMGMIKIEDVQETVNRLLPEHKQVVVIPDGPYVVGMVKD